MNKNLYHKTLLLLPKLSQLSFNWLMFITGYAGSCKGPPIAREFLKM